MDNLTLGQYASPWGPLAPEILLCALGLLLLVLDLVVPREKKHVLVGVALVGLLAALAACVAVLGNMGLMSGSPNYPKWLADCLRIDDFAMIFKILILVATILALLASPDYAKKRFTSGLGEYYAL
ncbi:MAG: hypothetical protein HY318_04175, partial [Armatimonadetes bacterium]|nr:hypothetical protein [Armatimonadota bacterium]